MPATLRALALLGRLGLAVATLALIMAALGAGTAFAAPVWQITMKKANPYGARAGECPNKEPEPQVPCGINPFTEAKGGEGEGGKGETFSRESGANEYKLVVTNKEGTTSAGLVSVEDRLPKGFAFAGEGEAIWSGEKWACKVLSEPERAVCQTTTALEPGHSYPLLTLRVHVSAEAENPSTNIPKVSGGGAASVAEVTQAEGETKVTNAVPFGIDEWNVDVDEPLGQAGGHPFSVSTTIVFNYTTDSKAALVPAGGPPKEALGEIPPGFIGNPLTTPRCPMQTFVETLPEKKCPADTVVGYTYASPASQGKIVGGKGDPLPEKVTERINESLAGLIYNLEPPPGAPAAFGFRVPATNSFFVLEAKLRSDGDYGVTVGDTAIPDKVLATTLTFCEHGADVHPVESHGGENIVRFACNEATPSVNPFLSNPTQCPASAAEQEESSLWTLVANPWDDPTNYVKKQSRVKYVNGKGEEEGATFLTGCNLLAFNPQMEFKPSPPSEGGTTMADAPTGMTLNLKVPQSEEASVNATPQLKDLVMKLPPGLTASPSAADGLLACSDSAFGLGTEFGPGSQHSEPAKPGSCPPQSQIGTFEVFTPLLSGGPTIEGKVEAGRVVTCSPGNWSGSPQLAYQWLRNGVPITIKRGGETVPANESEYTVQKEADEGKALQCQVTASNAGGRSVAVSSDDVVRPAVQTPPFPPARIAAPSGTPSPSSTLTCETGNWVGGPTFSYQWLRGGWPIPEAESAQYTLTSQDASQTVQCEVKAENAGGTTVSDSTPVVVSPPPLVTPPLPGGALQGKVFVGQPECSPCTEEHKDAAEGRVFRLFLEARNPLGCPAGNKEECNGVIVKLHGQARADEATGQLTTVFEDQPQQPFELLQLHLKGGPRATLANPLQCGEAISEVELTPWSAPGPISLTPRYTVDSDGAGGACPAVWPFNPSSNNGGTVGPNATTAGAFTHLTLTLGREDREQYVSGVEVHLPKGLVGKIASVTQCGEAEVHAAERNEGECPASSQVGVATAAAGPGSHPFYQKGKAYLTGPYKGGPFGLAVVTPAIAGPFNLGNIVVRARITLDPTTAAVTATSDPIPQMRDGVPLRLRKINVEVNNNEFMLNPTNCAEQKIAATITSSQGASIQSSSPFEVGGCQSLPFAPQLTATVDAQGSKANGLGFHVNISSPGIGQAGIAKVFLTVPNILPARLQPTLQHACLEATFNANPAGCDQQSVIGTGTVHTPLLKNPLTGPAYIVSHGNAAFPDVEFVLQGEGIELILDGKTDIKKGVTYSRFESAPDAPFTTFETDLPAGPHSIFTANTETVPNYNVCGQTISLPTEITGQNGAVIKQNTNVVAQGCAAAAKPSVKITKTEVAGNALLVTVKTSASGRLSVSGAGLRTAQKTVTLGTHKIRVALTKAGITRRKHHKKTTVHVRLVVGSQSAAKAKTVRL